MKSVISIIDRVMAKIENFIMFAAICIMLAVCAVQVVDRYILKTGIMWTSEILRIMLVWTICSGASVAAGKREHLGVMFLLSKLPEKLAKYVRLLTDILSIFVCSYVVASGFVYVRQQFELGSVFSITRWPTPVAQLAVPVCFLLMTIRIIFTIISDFTPKAELSGGGAEKGGAN